uniref:Uncharacterized protein n=1 Tax=Arundo donax TaxID=35708 RepID=A0A0A8YW89_ARUDO
MPSTLRIRPRFLSTELSCMIFDLL